MKERMRRQIRGGAIRWWILAAGLILATGISAAGASVLQQRYDFDTPTVTRSGEFDQVILAGAWSHGEPGEPVLPKAGATLLLPPGEEIVSVRVIPGEKILLPGEYRVEPGQRQYPLSYTGPAESDAPNAEIYASAAPFPGRLHDEARTGFLRGYQIATLALHPVEYLPAAGRLLYYRTLTVEIETAQSAQARETTERMIRQDEASVARVTRVVDNAPAVADYETVRKAEPLSRVLDPALAYKYVIVTGDIYEPYILPLADFETERGLKAGVFLKSWVVANYAGADEQAKIRSFILDAYTTWGSDFVLLVGDARDTNGIADRGFYASGYGLTDADIPADMYYGCLDGNWNTDGDSYWGEPSEADLYFEVGVGRACVDSPAEIQNFVTKQMRYQDQPVTGECDEALMVGELLWSDGTYGDDYKEEIRLGASTHGYTTVGFPASMHVGTLYDRQGTWTKATLISMMENGINLVNHLGHCNVTYALRMDNPDILSFDNDGLTHTYNFVYSQGCYCGSMDNRNDGGSYGTTDCFAEQWVADDAGAAAVVMNSRYGWGQHLSTDGSSQYFDRQFFDAIFGEHIYPLADVNDDSKMDNIWSIDYGANRWVYYELNVFGDPAMDLWTAEPATLTCDYPAAVMIGANEITVQVARPGGMPLANARVAVYTDDYSAYDTGLTGPLGMVTLHPTLAAPGLLHVQVTAHDFLAHRGSSTITPPEGPYLVFEDREILDVEGDGDGVADAGEAIGIALTLENVGVEAATGVSATVATGDPYATIVAPTRAFPDIPAHGFGTNAEPFGVEIAGNVPDQHEVNFTAQVSALEGSWSAGFRLYAAAPVLACGRVLVYDGAGNADGGADPGETVSLQVSLVNSGHSSTPPLTATLTSSDPRVAIHGGQSGCPAFEVGEEGLLSAFQVEILADCPAQATVPFEIACSAGNGFTAQLGFNLDVGGWLDAAESDRGWTCGAAGDNATSGIWLRAEPVGTVEIATQVQPEYDHTEDPGEVCFVTGNADPGQGPGTNDVDGGRTTLVTPAFDLSEAISATVQYWRWYTNDLGNNPGQDWWGVDITSDGTNWVSLEHTQASNNSWAQFTFNVGDFVALTDQVRMRFIAEDASPGSLVEAAVDDFLLDAILALPSGMSADQVREGYGMIAYGPNPSGRDNQLLYRLARKTDVRIELFDPAGRKVRTLVDGPVDGGAHALAFDGRDGSGRPLASGIYFLRMQTPEMLEVRQITMLK